MKQEYIDNIRTFNRYYTKVLGVLNKHYLGSEFGVAEVRIIQDIYLHPNRSAKEIAVELDMDKGFLSRLLKQFEQKEMYVKSNFYYYFVVEKGLPTQKQFILCIRAGKSPLQWTV